MEQSWDERLTNDLKALPSDAKLRGYIDANRDAIARAVRGLGPDATEPTDGAGAHVVMNIAAAHVRAFCDDKGPVPYKNGYDLGKYAKKSVVGTRQPDRVTVDKSLPLDAGDSYEKVYFGAVEVNGTGIRFYGDICFVLRRDRVDDETVILDRNSYDLIRLPLVTGIDNSPSPDVERRKVAKRLHGRWAADLPAMAARKLVEMFARRDRRLTTGEISNGVLADEDYIEVLWLRKPPDSNVSSFGPADLLEVRLSASDVAHEARIGERELMGPMPPSHELEWRRRRRDAEAALRAKNVAVRVVTTAGRVR